MILPLVVLVLGLGLAGAAATTGVAAAAVSQVELTRWVSYKLRGASGAADVLQNPGRVLATANALTTLGALSAAAAVPALLPTATPTVLALATVLGAVPLVVVVAFLVPRVVGRRWAEPIVARVVPRLEQLGTALAPFVPARDPSKRTTLAAVLTSADTGALASADEIAVVSGVLAFADRPVRELMTPRTAIVALPEGILAAEAAHVCMQAGYSRYPVIRGSLDEIVGVVHALDLLTLPPDAPVPVRPALVVPATTRTADVMLEMQRGRGLLAVVLDEFGGTAGLITFQDLLRDLVAEIFEPEAPPTTSGAPPRIAELDGNASIAALEQALGVTLERPRAPAAGAGGEAGGGGRGGGGGGGGAGAGGAHTVGGLLVQALGRIPRPGERFAFHGLEFDVLAASATRVERVAVRPGPVRTVALERAPDEA